MKKTVLITGGAGGIGAACAKKFALNGYFVAINYRNSEQEAFSLLKEIKSFGGVARLFQGDVSRVSDVDRIHSELKKSFGLPGVLINNSGVALQKLFTSTSYSEWNSIFSNNVGSMFLCCKKFIPNMINHKWGRIINISSIWGLVGASCEVAYSASKAAVVGFSKALAKELAPSNITVNCLAPGLIDTKMNKGLTDQEINSFERLIPCGKIGTGLDVAQAALFFADEKTSYITGQILNVDGGFI